MATLVGRNDTNRPPESALTRSNQDATRYSHFEPPALLMAKMFDLWRIWNHFKPPRAPLWQFQGIQIVPSDLPGCVPPISNQDPTRSTHSEPTGPLMSGNGYFMEHSGQFPAQQNPLTVISGDSNGTNRHS